MSAPGQRRPNEAFDAECFLALEADIGSGAPRTTLESRDECCYRLENRWTIILVLVDPG